MMKGRTNSDTRQAAVIRSHCLQIKHLVKSQFDLLKRS
jgi:hypothetical protein